MSYPLVSVILPVFNNASTVVVAARSILRQSVKDLELIVIDDGSTDDSYRLAAMIKDPRVRLYRNDRNLGVSITRNRGIDLMRGDFMAPMDADDVCRSDRLALTLDNLQTNPDNGLCGGWALWKGWGGLPFVGRLPWGKEAVQAYLLYGMPSPHDAILFRNSVLHRFKIRYPENLLAAVDYDFYRQFAAVAYVDNVPRVLMEYRCNPNGISRTRSHQAVERRLEGLREELGKLFADDVDKDTLIFHAQIGNGTGAKSKQQLQSFGHWLSRIERQNRKKRIYSQDGLAKATAMVWFLICRNSAYLGLCAWRAWRASEWSRWYRPTARELLSFAGSGFLARMMPSRRHPQGTLAGL